jgi:hypothetical protein
LARDLEPCVFKERHHRRTVGDQARINLVIEGSNDDLSSLGTLGALAHQFEITGKVRFHRVRPTVGFVQHVAQSAERCLMPRRRDVQCPARRQFQARRAKVQLDIAFMHMAHPKAVVLIRLKPRKG